MSAMPLKSQVLSVYQKAQPLIQQSKMVALGTLEKSRIVSKAALEKGTLLGQQAAKAAQQSWESQVASGKLAQLAKEKGQHYSRKALSSGCTTLSKVESFFLGPLRNSFLISKHVLKQVNAVQDFGPPSVESWTVAKESYKQLWRRMQQTHVLDYTWNQVAYGSRMVLEIFAFYYIGKALGSGLQRAVST